MVAFAQHVLRKMRRANEVVCSCMEKAREMLLKREAIYMSTLDSAIAKDAIVLPQYAKYLPATEEKSLIQAGSVDGLIGVNKPSFSERSPGASCAGPSSTADNTTPPANNGSKNSKTLTKVGFPKRVSPFR